MYGITEKILKIIFQNPMSQQTNGQMLQFTDTQLSKKH